jgi:hypothetical protein
MIEKLGRFEERKGASLNSHSAMELPRYRNMLQRYKEVAKRNAYSFKFGKDELLEIFGK